MDVKITFNDFTVTGANQLNNVTIKLLKGEKGDPGEPTDAQVTSAVNTWLAAHPEATTTVQDGAISYAKLDSTLKAKADDVDDLKSSISAIGVPSSVKIAIKSLLLSALYKDVDLTGEKAIIEDWASVHMISISASFEQGNETIYNTDSLDYLKQFLTVIAHYDDGSSNTISNYILNGELTEGTSAITATASGLSATFNVIVTANPLPDGYTLYDYITANGSQYIQTQITEAQATDFGYECKESASPIAQGNGHILSSANVYFPHLSRGNTATDLWVALKRYGNETKTDVVGNSHYEANAVYVFKAFIGGTDDVLFYDSNGELQYSFKITKGSTGLTSTNKFCLFTYGGGATTTKYRFHGNFYYLKLSDANGNLVHYFIPCMNANNVVGLYDTVENTFLSPTAGTLTGKAR